MSEARDLQEFLLLSRGKWDAGVAPETIQGAIDDFYVWLEQHVAAGRMRTGERLSNAGGLVSRSGVLTDGPFIESKEVIGGYWFVLAPNLDEACALVADSPCLAVGLSYEIRPLERVRASAFDQTNETPSA